MPSYSCLSVADSVKEIIRRRPVLEPVLRSFEPVFTALGTVSDALSSEIAASGLKLSEFDAELERQGVSLLAGTDCSGMALFLRKGAESLLPLLVQAAGLHKEGDGLHAFFVSRDVEARDPREMLSAAILSSDDSSVEKLAEEAGVDASALKFAGEKILSVILRAMVKNHRNEHDGKNSWDDGNRWQQGYCPVCGSFPVLGWLDKFGASENNPFLVSGSGRKHLYCGTCGADWLFKRGACPACNSQDKGAVNVLRQSGINYGERIDWCDKCKAYSPVVDLRETEYMLNPDIMALGMMHLDILAHDKQLNPTKISFWNAL